MIEREENSGLVDLKAALLAMAEPKPAPRARSRGPRVAVAVLSCVLAGPLAFAATRLVHTKSIAPRMPLTAPTPPEIEIPNESTKPSAPIRTATPPPAPATGTASVTPPTAKSHATSWRAPALSVDTSPVERQLVEEAEPTPQPKPAPEPNTASALDRGPPPQQVRPGLGAVLVAVRAVLPTARACLQHGDDTPRAADVRFGSDGTPDAITLARTGERAATDATNTTDECLRSALGAARVEPFLDTHYTTRVVVHR